MDPRTGVEGGRRSRLRYGVVAVACLALGVALAPSWSSAAETFKDVIVRNTASDPVPVSLPAPKLHASADTISGSDRVTVPAGIVVTDIVVTSRDPDCTSVSIGMFDNPSGASPLSIDRFGEPTTQLHLETGVRSTAEEPLTMQVPVTCAALVFWSGYEG